MNKRTTISLLQNTAIVLLSITAVFLLLRVISYETGSTVSISRLWGEDSSENREIAYSTDLSAMDAPCNLVITGTYGRSSMLLGDALHDRKNFIAENGARYLELADIS